MEKNKVIIYGVGGVALVGIALYLYNKSKNITRSGTDLEASENSMVGQMPINIPTNLPTPSGMIVPVLGVTPSGDTSGAYSPNPSYSGGFVDDKFTSTPTTSSVPSTSSIPRPSTPSGAGEVVPSTSDVDLFVDPTTTLTKVTTTTTNTTTSSPVLVKGFDGSFSYANGRRMRTRRLFNI